VAPGTYLNFDLLIDSTANGYRARVIEAPAGQAAVDFQLPAHLRQQDNRLALVGGAIRAYQFGVPDDAPTLQPLDPHTFGQQLYETVFAGQVGVSLRRSQDLAQQQGAGLRIRLRLTYAPELALLPWEYLYSPEERRFLVLSDYTPLVRYLELGRPAPPLKVTPPLRLLVMISDPTDVSPRLQVEREWEQLQRALAELQGRNGVTLQRIPATLSALQRELRRGAYHLFHFIGHGWYDEATSEAGLVLENDQGRGQRINATRLGILLQDHRTLRLALLNACEGARGAQGEPFAGVAQHLVQQGLPAVIAMQFPISDRAAIGLAQEFYGALADGLGVDTALNQARKAIYLQNSVMEWGTPALFSRADDNQLFDVPGEQQTETKPPPASTSTVVNTGGGSYIAGPVNIGQGDFVGRSKHIGRRSDQAAGTERASWQAQLRNHQDSLRLVEERMADYVLSTDIPLQLVREKERLLARIQELEERLAEG
jgi:hypothetical protein